MHHSLCRCLVCLAQSCCHIRRSNVHKVCHGRAKLVRVMTAGLWCSYAQIAVGSCGSLCMQGDNAWSIGEEYCGGGHAWPGVVSRNPQNSASKPAAGTSFRVRVRYGR